MNIVSPRLAIMGSGSGTTAETFIRATVDGRVAADVVLVISDHPKKGLFDRVRDINQQYDLAIKTVEVSPRTDPLATGEPPTRGITSAESQKLLTLMQQHNVDLVLLMGYMRVIRGPFLAAYGFDAAWHTSIYQCRLLNTHPGPLSETTNTYGLLTSKKVLDLNLAESKHTLHAVAAGVDEGPVVAATPVPVISGDTPQTLFDRVQLIEKAVLPPLIDNFLTKQRLAEIG